MSNPDPAPANNNRLIVIGVIALFAVLCVAAFMFFRRGGADQVAANIPAAVTPRGLVSADQVARELERDPRSRATVAAFRETFPAEWNALTTEMATRVRQGATADQLRQYGFDTMRNFALGRAAQLAAAPEPELRQVTLTQLAMARALQSTDAPMCARFTASGLAPTDMAVFPPSAQDELDAAVRAQLVATRAGTDRPAARPQPTPAEIQQFLSAFQAAGGNMTILQAAGAYPVGDGVEACRSGVAVYQAVANLPPDVGARVMGFIVSQAAAAQASSPPPSAAPPAAGGGGK